MWGAAIREEGIVKGHGKTFKGDRHVYYINCGNDLPVYIYVKIYPIVHFEYVQFIVCHIVLLFFQIWGSERELIG